MSAPVRLGLIGVGRWGTVYIRTIISSLHERCRVSHLATSRPENRTLVPYPVAVTPDWRQVLAGDCDAVIIATPPQTHAEILEACVDAGKPCLVEKPLCLDVATAERLHRRVEAAEVPVLVGHTQLFNPAYRALKQALRQAGEAVRAVVSEGMALGPFRTDVPALWDWAPHDVSLSLDLVGETPERVSVLGGPQGLQEAPEMVSLRLDFPGGACAWIQAGRLSTEKRRRLSVFTEHRVYVCDDLAPNRLAAAPIEFSQRAAGGIPEPLGLRPIPSDPSRSPMAAMLAAFLDGIASGRREGFGTALAVDVVRVLAAAEAELKQTAKAKSPQRAAASQRDQVIRS